MIVGVGMFVKASDNGYKVPGTHTVVAVVHKAAELH